MSEISKTIIRETVDQMVSFIESTPDITDDDGFRILNALRHRRGFAILVMSRGDVESAWQQRQNGENGTEDPMPEEFWEKVQDAWSWKKGFNDGGIMDLGWLLVNDAIDDAERS